MKTSSDVLFRLSGETREYATALLKFSMLKNGGRPNPLPDEIKLAYELLGTQSPVIQIKHFFEGLPRAYETIPMVCLHPFKEDEFYMIAPVGYDGTYFTPEDAIHISDKNKAEAIMKGLFAEGWTDPAYLIRSRQAGVATPSDYDPDKSLHLITNAGLHTPANRYVFFKPKDKNTVFSTVDDEDTVRELFTNATGGKIEVLLKKPAAEKDWIDKILNKDMLRPLIRDFPCGPTLAYRCDDPSTFTFCPEGYERISAAEFQWMDEDQKDITIGIAPPPNLSPAMTAAAAITGKLTDIRSFK